MVPDKHLRVFVLPPEVEQTEEELAKARRRFEERARSTNFGFRRIEVLDDNIGYLDLRKFADPRVAGSTAVAAMGVLANVDALIFDVRNNSGGSPYMVQLLASYLLEEPPLHLNDHYVRSSDLTRQYYSFPWLPGQRRPDIPVFVLTSDHTFSAAEGFAYLLQSLERAIIIGESTAGGAHPVKVVGLGNGLAVSIPFATTINPVTKTNWEGVGVVPDITVAAEDALRTAITEAKNAVAATSH